MRKTPDIKVKIGKLQLKSPMICASGTFGYGVEMERFVDFSHLGAFITKTITLQSRRGNPPPRIIEVETGVLNSIGLENPGVDYFIEKYLPQIEKIPCDFIVSIGGNSFEEYREVLKRLEPIRTIKAYEINLSCPNLRLKKMISQDPLATRKIMKSLRQCTGKTLIAKITGEVEDIARIVVNAKSGGADAISLVNTFLGMGIDIDKQKPYLGNIYGGYSGKGIKPLSLYRVWKVAQAVKIPLIAGGGITTPEDAIEFLLAGAHALSVGTVTFLQPDAFSDILKGIVSYMFHRKIKNIHTLIGGMHE